MTIFGHHTAAEVKDLIAAKDFENARMQAAYDALPATVDAGSAEQDWANDWNAYTARYAVAKGRAASKLDLVSASGVDPKNFPAEDEWIALLQAESRVGAADKILGRTAEGPYKNGDKQDLYNRLVLLRGGKGIDFTGLPQPSPGTDTDLNAFKAADAFTSGLEKNTNPTRSIWPWVAGAGVLGGLYLVWKLK